MKSAGNRGGIYPVAGAACQVFGCVTRTGRVLCASQAQFVSQSFGYLLKDGRKVVQGLQNLAHVIWQMACNKREMALLQDMICEIHMKVDRASVHGAIAADH
jgi:hypothetical protein